MTLALLNSMVIFVRLFENFDNTKLRYTFSTPSLEVSVSSPPMKPFMISPTANNACHSVTKGIVANTDIGRERFEYVFVS